jgi:site-specific recombinase XerD
MLSVCSSPSQASTLLIVEIATIALSARVDPDQSRRAFAARTCPPVILNSLICTINSILCAFIGDIANMSKNTAINQLKEILINIEGAYAPSTIRAYKADFHEFIHYCDDHEQGALPANPIIPAKFIVEVTDSGRSSASIRRLVCGISLIHRLNRHQDPTKDHDFTLEMRRMHRKLGRSSKQAGGINANTLVKLLLVTDDSIRGIRDRALLLVAYDTLCRRNELVSLRVKDVKINIKNGTKTSSILLRRGKTDQDSTGKWLHLSERTHIALAEWIKKLPKGQEMLFCGLNRALDTSPQIGVGQIYRIYKKIARKVGLDESEIKGISGHSMRVGAAQDLLNSGAGMPIIMQRGRWSKTDTIMRYLEHSVHSN